MEGVVKFGDNRTRFGEPIYKANKYNSDGSKEMCMIYISWEGEARVRSIARDKVINFMVSKYVIEEILLEDSRSVYVPDVIGHKVIEEYQDKRILNKEYYLSYEPRHIPSNIVGISLEDYAKYLGRDIARFMYCGMNNVPRHLRPNFRNNSFRTCMIDLDVTDPRVFDWILADSYSVGGANYQGLLMLEEYFFTDAPDSFLNALLPDQMRTDDVIKKLYAIYSDSFIEEVKGLKGVDVSHQFKIKPLVQR